MVLTVAHSMTTVNTMSAMTMLWHLSLSNSPDT